MRGRTFLVVVVERQWTQAILHVKDARRHQASREFISVKDGMNSTCNKELYSDSVFGVSSSLLL